MRWHDILNKTLGIFLLSMFACNTFAEEQSTLQYSATEIANGLYMLEGVGGFTGGNIALSVGDDGIVMIDDGIPEALDMMLEAIKNITNNKSVDFLINTHFHWDHAGNNGPMAKHGTRIFAHENARLRLQEELGKAEDDALPVFTFSQNMQFYLNGHDTHILHVAHAHTDGDIIIHFKDQNVLHTGDVYVNGNFPYIDIDSGGSMDGIIAAHEVVLALSNDKTKIIPGHGALASRSDVEETVAMLQHSKKLISALISQGKSENEVVAISPLAQYQSWRSNFITLEKMTRQVYQSLLKQQEK